MRILEIILTIQPQQYMCSTFIDKKKFGSKICETFWRGISLLFVQWKAISLVVTIGRLRLQLQHNIGMYTFQGGPHNTSTSTRVKVTLINVIFIFKKF